MRFIRAWAYKCSGHLTKQLNDNHERRRVYYYGFQIVIGGIVKLILLVLITLLLGTFLPTFTVLLFFGALRIAAGGYHMDDYTRCMAVSFGIFILLGAIAKYTDQYWGSWMLAVLSAAVFLAALITVVKWAPADTPNKPITKAGQVKRLKRLSAVIVFAWLAADIILLYNNLGFYVLAGCLGISMAAFIVSPAGYRFFDFIGGKGCKANQRPISS